MSAQKRQLEKSRQERAAAKRERRQARPQDNPTDEVGTQDTGPEVDQDELLAQFADLHRRWTDGAMSLEEFEEARDELAQRLRLD